ncbi:uncharacterized protein [Arachis hypogaea]|uniref:uncharacterized protein n=1 Tax=Arachis hypogaea TaxID=3818 RepID=UPI000DED127A|nr:uncharacterized protein LOC112771359 [Arachis hypogaea]
MKTPHNSEDELESNGKSDEFSILKEGQRFGELKLQVGMKFNTKQEFKDVVQEFTIQEERWIKFIKQDSVRCRAVCQVDECCWIEYASRDHEDCCWQIKIFYDDHICPRKNSNRATNRAWLASKLVKKVRKYLNFKQCEAVEYFKSKCDLILHRNSIARALADARNVVYQDEKAQYAMLRDYVETLLKNNLESTVKIGVTPLLDGQIMFEKMYVCLSGCKNRFKAGYRPLIGLDSAFLETQIGGQILSAMAQDANHHIYVITWAIVNIENKENWK